MPNSDTFQKVNIINLSAASVISLISLFFIRILSSSVSAVCFILTQVVLEYLEAEIQRFSWIIDWLGEMMLPFLQESFLPSDL